MGSVLSSMAFAISTRSARSIGAETFLSTSASVRCRTVGFELLLFQFLAALFPLLSLLCRVGCVTIRKVDRATRFRAYLGDMPTLCAIYHDCLGHVLAWLLVGRERLFCLRRLCELQGNVAVPWEYSAVPACAVVGGDLYQLGFCRNLPFNKLA